jgi:RNA polymerase sigma-70 factor, ECF subfamily
MTPRDPADFAAVYEEHSRGALHAALRVLGSRSLAQDVVQDVFLRLWRHPEKFDPRRGDIGAYLRLMARSRALDLWRERQAAGRASDRLQAAVVPEPRAEARPAEVAERESERRELRAALGALPASQRDAVVLAYWGGLTADEIARRSGVPLGTAKRRVRLGLARLRGQFTEPVAA